MSSNANENCERSSQRDVVDNAGYLIPFVDNEEYTIPNSGELHVHKGRADVRSVEKMRSQNFVVENSTLGGIISADDGNLEHIVADFDEIQTEVASEDEMSKESTLQASSTNKETILKHKISPQSPSDDCYSNGMLQNDSVSDDIVSVYVLPNSDQKLDVEGQSEADGAAKISAENSHLQPSDSALEDGNSTDDVALVYIEPISDGTEPATCSQANGGRQGDDVANDGGNVPDYQVLDQKKRKIEAKSRYQKLIKRKVVWRHFTFICT